MCGDGNFFDIKLTGGGGGEVGTEKQQKKQKQVTRGKSVFIYL